MLFNRLAWLNYYFSIERKVSFFLSHGEAVRKETQAQHPHEHTQYSRNRRGLVKLASCISEPGIVHCELQDNVTWVVGRQAGRNLFGFLPVPLSHHPSLCSTSSTKEATFFLFEGLACTSRAGELHHHLQ